MAGRYSGFGSEQSSNDDFVTIGTHFDPSEPTNSTSILATFGRKASKLVDLSSSNYGYDGKRFHGAFTGGFNAGFYNTVGSVEGWQPSDFKSSRSSRAEKRTFEPEDFMDKGDFSEHGINPKQIKIRNTFDHNDSISRLPGKASAQRGQDDVLRDFIRVKSLSIGKRILMSMGWKPGEGVGVKVARKFREKLKRSLIQEQNQSQQEPAEPVASEGVKVYGVAMPPSSYKKTSRLDDDDDDDDDDHLYANVSLPPLDYEVHFKVQKQEHHGIGYKPLESLSLFGHDHLFVQPSVEKRINNVKIRGQAFGVGIEEDEDDRDLFAEDDLKQYDYELTGINDKVTDVMKKQDEKYSFILKFVRYDSTVDPVVYPPPLIPPEFRIGHKFAKSEMASMPKPTETNTETSQTKKPSIQHDATTRGILLGDLSFLSRPPPNMSQTTIPLTPAPTVSTAVEVADMVPASPAPSISDQSTAATPRPTNSIASLEWDVEAQRTVSTATPMASNPRTQFLDSVRNRFTSSGDHAQLTERQSLEAALQADLKKAVSMNLYGDLTRSTREWKPNPLLCKRMNIPNPYSDDAYEDTKDSKKSRRQLCSNLFEHLFTQTPSNSTNTGASNVKVPVEPSRTRAASPPTTVSMSVSETKPDTDEEEEVEEQVESSSRPPMDLFSAIFENQDSDDDDDLNEPPPAPTKSTIDSKVSTSKSIAKEVVPLTKVSTIVRRRSTSSSEQSDSSDSSVEEIPKPTISSKVYGPAVPNTIESSKSEENLEMIKIVSHDEDEYVELKQKKKHKKKKKKKNKKSKKHRRDS